MLRGKKLPVAAVIIGSVCVTAHSVSAERDRGPSPADANAQRSGVHASLWQAVWEELGTRPELGNISNGCDFDGDGRCLPGDLLTAIDLAGKSKTATAGTGTAAGSVGGAEFELEPDRPGPYGVCERVTVSVFLRQTSANDDHFLRFVQCDFADSDPALTLTLPVTHTAPKGVLSPSGDLHFWDFSSTPVCMSAAEDCGSGHVVDDELPGALPPGPGVINITYIGDLSESPDRQIRLPDDTGEHVRIGELVVTLPAVAGSYVLDLMNADESDTALGARIDFGFEPRVTWLAYTGELIGGVAMLAVVDEGTAPDCNGNMVADACDIASGTSDDCNGNGVPDECELADGTADDCNGNDSLDECDLADGTSPDCNTNGVPDQCDVDNGTSDDCNANGVPDECEECCVNADCDDGDICTDEVCDNGVCSNPESGICGACCDRISGVCLQRVPPNQCVGQQVELAPGVQCQDLDPACAPSRGACCDAGAGLPGSATCEQSTFAECGCETCTWFKDESCASVIEQSLCRVEAVPAVSEWGLVVLTLLLLTAAKVYFGVGRDPRTS